MKHLFLILILGACSAAPVKEPDFKVLTTPPPVFNITFNNQSAAGLGVASQNEPSQKCYEIPIYGINGEFLRNDKQCR